MIETFTKFISETRMCNCHLLVARCVGKHGSDSDQIDSDFCTQVTSAPLVAFNLEVLPCKTIICMYIYTEWTRLAGGGISTEHHAHG